MLAELEMAGRLVTPTRLYLFFPFEQSERDVRWRALRPTIEQHLGHAIPESVGDAAFIGFRDDWTAEPIACAPTGHELLPRTG